MNKSLVILAVNFRINWRELFQIFSLIKRVEQPIMISARISVVRKLNIYYEGHKLIERKFISSLIVLVLVKWITCYYSILIKKFIFR